MKKLIAVIFFGLCGYCSFGQAVNITILAGPNVSTFAPGGNSPEASIDLTGRPSSLGWGFHAGVLAEFPFGRLAIEPGLLYQSISSSVNAAPSEFESSSYAETFTVQYLQVPLNILYYIPFKTGKYFLGGGPYVAFGLSGTVTQTFSDPNFNPGPLSGKYTFSSSDNPDYGFNLVAGIQVQGNFKFSFGYGKGFRTENPHSVCSFSIGHTIW